MFLTQPDIHQGKKKTNSSKVLALWGMPFSALLSYSRPNSW